MLEVAEVLWYDSSCASSGTKSGVWLSLVERIVRDDEVAGSNPVTPITLSLKTLFMPGSQTFFE